MSDSPADRTDDAVQPDESADSSTPSDADEFDDDAFDAEEFDDPPSYESSGSGMGGRDVEVPMRVYKTVTVFSTLIAVIFVVAGFVILDRATGRATLPLAEVDPVLSLLGIGVILFGAGTYAFGTRFRARGMGTSKNDDDEAADNG